MKISAQEEYGLRCLLRLARVENGEALTIPEIATDEGLSTAYVGKLLAVLRQAGIIDSERGRSGGYRLASPASQIGLGTVFAALGEPLFDEPNYCERHKGSVTEGSCVHTGNCTLRSLWFTLEHWMRSALDRITLADLLQNETQIGDLVRSRLATAGEGPRTSLIPLTAFSRG
jgi:Rrf2 family protein